MTRGWGDFHYNFEHHDEACNAYSVTGACRRRLVSNCVVACSAMSTGTSCYSTTCHHTFTGCTAGATTTPPLNKSMEQREGNEVLPAPPLQEPENLDLLRTRRYEHW